MAATQSAEVVVGIDGSPSSLGALEWAARQADMLGATLLVVAVWNWPRSYGGLVLMPDSSIYDPAADAQRLLDTAVSTVQQAHAALKITTRVVQGHAALVLVEASSGAEVLVVGSRGHGEFVGMLLGSVSEYCVAHAHCPVLVYHHRG